MHFLSTFRNLCTDCFPFFKGNISNLHYDYVEGVENSWHQEETAAWNANSDRSNPNTNNLEMIEANKSSSVSTNISFKENNNEKIVEEKIIKKEEKIEDDEPDYFKDMKIETGNKINFNNIFASAKTDKFKLDDNLEPGEGWMQDTEINLD